MITQWDDIHSVGASLLLHSCFFIRSFSKHLMTLKSYENIYHANARTELSLAGILGVHLEVLLTIFQPEGADYVHHITASTPGFENLTTSL
jgi:hypothetical protein